MSIRGIIKNTLILATLITVIHQWPALVDQQPVGWLAILLSYFAVFLTLFLLLRTSSVNDGSAEDAFPRLDPQHLNALYRQASLVERNAHKSSAVFIRQLKYIQKLRSKLKNLDHGDDYSSARTELIGEMEILEKYVSRAVSEMNKNVKLGEKLQQSIANIDPDIGVL